MERYELDAWLGEDHGLTEDQITDLLWQADEIEAHYPGPDDQDERTAAMIVAHRLIQGEHDVIEDLAEKLTAARVEQVLALAGLRQAAIIQITAKGAESEAGFARQANVDRMTVRKWLGK